MPLLEFQSITKRFPGIHALSEVTLTVEAGTVHGLMGENGAGKSTLGKILAGLYQPEAGRIVLEGQPVHFANPAEAMRAGIGMVHQELALCENLSVAENLCLDHLPHRGLLVSRKAMETRARALLEPLGVSLEVTQPAGSLAIGQRQLVQIAAAVGRGARLIIFDEPTSSLSEVEAQRLHELIRRLKERGVTSLYVSHRLPEIFALCDTISVLRDGRHVGTRPCCEVNESDIVQLMIGRPLGEYFPAHLKQPPGKALLEVHGLSSPGRFEDLSFTVHEGEVLGLAGLVGAGRTELAEALFGLDPRATGTVLLEGKPLPLRSPRRAIDRGLGLVPEDRQRHGLVRAMRGRANLTLPILPRLAQLGWVRAKAERALATEYFQRLNIRSSGLEMPVEGLSGGNQQKIVLARWLAAKCRLLLLDEPTRGVDVGSKAEIHQLIDDLSRQGAGVLLISSELPEVLNLSTRILVLREGRIVAQMRREEATQEGVLRAMAGL